MEAGTFSVTCDGHRDAHSVCSVLVGLEICFSQLDLALPSWDPSGGFLLQLHWDMNGICEGWTETTHTQEETWSEAGIQMSERLPGI